MVYKFSFKQRQPFSDPLSFRITIYFFSYEAQHVRKCLMSGWLESNVLPHKVSLTIAGWMDKIRQQLGVLFDQDEADR